MRSNNVLLFIVLVTLSFSNAFEFTNLAAVKQLRGNAYGNSLIETISLTLQNTGSVDDIQKLLNDLLFKLNSDQELATTTWKKVEADLIAKEMKLSSEIEELRKTILIKEGRVAELDGLISTAEINLRQYADQKAMDAGNLEKLEIQRKKDSDEYIQSVAEHTDVINAIQEVIKELIKLKGSVSGEGKPVHVEEISQETRDREYKNPPQATSFLQVTKDEIEALLFAQLATTADQAALEKLLKLLDEILESTKKSQNEDTAHEERSKKSYEELKATLNEDIKQLDKNIIEQEKNKKAYEDERETLKNDLEQHKMLKASKEKELESTKKEREEKEAQYKADTLERDEERKVIQHLQEIIEERLVNMSKFLKVKTGAF